MQTMTHPISGETLLGTPLSPGEKIGVNDKYDSADGTWRESGGAVGLVIQPGCTTMWVSQPGSLPRNELLESVALALEGRGGEQLLGMQGIEDRELQVLLFGPVKYGPLEAALTMTDAEFLLSLHIDGTIFGAIAEELAELGHERLTTIGEVARALGIDTNDAEVARENIHRLGCWCIGALVEARTVAERVRALKR